MGELHLVDRYCVVVNQEEQYSILPASLELPLGWRSTGKEGTKANCLSYIATVWKDMRPISARSTDPTDANP
jgi:MbtH protein